MTKRELVTHISIKTGLTLEKSANALEAVMDGIKESLGKGEKVLISDFGSFELRLHQAHIARNPQTGDTVWIEAAEVPVFRASNAFKSLIKTERSKTK